MTNEASRNIPRRTLAAGAAWSVPAVAFAAKANAQASSGSVTLTQTRACKSPGNSCKTFEKGYIFTFSSVNTHPCAVTISAASLTITSGSFPGTPSIDTPIAVPQGTTAAFVIQINASNSGNSAFTGTLSFTYEDCNGNTITNTTTVTVTGTPPDCACPGTTTTTTTLAPTTTTSTTEAPTTTTSTTTGGGGGGGGARGTDEAVTGESAPATDTASTTESASTTDTVPTEESAG